MPALDVLVARYHQRYLVLQGRAAQVTGQLFDRFAGPSDAELDDYVRHVVPVAAGARVAGVQLVAGYLAAVGQLALGDPEAMPVDQTTVLAGIRGGVALDELYGRAIVTLRKQLADGAAYGDAFGVARRRAAETAKTDVVLANRDAAAAGMDNQPHVVGYRRVLSGQSCVLCATASTQRYRNEPAPIHAGCDCGFAPIIGDQDPGQVVNRQLLAGLKDQGGSKYWEGRYGIDEDGVLRHRHEVPVIDDSGHPVLREDGRAKTRMELGDPVKVAVHTHGEYGPTLTDAAHEFTGPGGVAA